MTDDFDLARLVSGILMLTSRGCCDVFVGVCPKLWFQADQEVSCVWHGGDMGSFG